MSLQTMFLEDLSTRPSTIEHYTRPMANDIRTAIPAMLMRGGSSKGLYFLADDLPTDPNDRADLLRRVMGSPDPRQIDGMGGAHPLTSKVAVVRPCATDRADVEYLFLQVGVDTDVVTDRQNCGNLLAGVAPFALERGLISVEADAAEATMRILMLNTDTVATARFSVVDGAPQYDAHESEAVSVSGVPGTASPIHLEFEDLGGGSCGEMLPTGNNVDIIDDIECTLVDNGMPVVVLRAADVGIDGDETCAELEANEILRVKLESIRLQAGLLMNLGNVTETTVPKMTMVSAPKGDGHLNTRTFIPHRCHEAIGVLGAVSVATAALLPGSAADSVTLNPIGHTVRLEHPTGHFDAVIELTPEPDVQGQTPNIRLSVERAGIVRTARKIMDGTVFPRAVEPRPSET